MEIANNKMRYYDALKTTPPEAKKTIGAGRLKGFTDIKTMWRIRRLTEVFGPCGIGWKVVVTEQKIIPQGEEAKAFVSLDLFIRDGESWSEAIPGLGGSSFVAKENKGLYVSDECFKMAFSDALGSACKLLGMSEDVHWTEGYTKYSMPSGSGDGAPPTAPSAGANRGAKKYQCPACGRPLTDAEAAKGLHHFDAPLCEPCVEFNWERRVRD